MSGQSNVGNSQVYEAGDQKNVPQSEIEQEKKDNRFHEGKEHSHKALDSSMPYQIALPNSCANEFAVQRTRDRLPTSWLVKRRLVPRSGHKGFIRRTL